MKERGNYDKMSQKVENKFQWVVSKIPSILDKKVYLKESLFERIYIKQVTRVDLILNGLSNRDRKWA